MNMTRVLPLLMAMASVPAANATIHTGGQTQPGGIPEGEYFGPQEIDAHLNVTSSINGPVPAQTAFSYHLKAFADLEVEPCGADQDHADGLQQDIAAQGGAWEVSAEVQGNCDITGVADEGAYDTNYIGEILHKYRVGDGEWQEPNPQIDGENEGSYTVIEEGGGEDNLNFDAGDVLDDGETIS